VVGDGLVSSNQKPLTGHVSVLDYSIHLSPDNWEVGMRFGEEILVMDLNLDGIQDIIVSAPYQGSESLLYPGKVFIYYGGLEQETPHAILVPPRQSCPFLLGKKLFAIDIDGDGYDDLVIASPEASNCVITQVSHV
jgi:hypothetical protein